MTTIEEFRDEAREYVALVETDPEAAVQGLHRLENRMRGIAWSATGRVAAREITADIRTEIDRISRERDWTAPPFWPFSDVVAGGPGWRTNRKGYRQ